MRNFMAFLLPALAGLAMSAPAPYPVTVNSRAQTAPPVIAYRGNESTFRVSFVDGSTASDLTGVVPFMAWATNASATVNSTSTYAVVGSATNGVVDFTFSPASVNYTPYRYMYEVGVKSTSGVPRVYRQGTFTIAGSPIGGGADAFVGITNVSWAAYNWIGLPSWLLPADTNGWETGSHASFLTSAPPQSVVSVNGQTGAVVITAAGIGALTNEADLAALRTYHYGSPDIIESPAEWFQFDGAGVITAFNWETGRTNVVIPWAISGEPVVEIADSAFRETGVRSVIVPSNVTAIRQSTFNSCPVLSSVSIRGDGVIIESYVFENCSSLKYVSFSGDVPTAGDIFSFTPSNQVTNYVTNPTATGWTETLGGMPVVRLPLHTDSLTLGGVTHTNWPVADVSGLATTQSVAAVAGGLDLAAITLNNHTANGTIGSDGHASSIEKAAWNAKLDASGGTASNLTVRGWIALPQSAPTNLVLRLVCSNEHIYVEEVYP